ncbi:hypothetical protein [Halobacteriovorax sp. JY17]|uniref:hypothetical protein n=1 Tax=Halobacteriovorax sp. JY17 TaxID=2014617 RepID=UPI000C4A428D|nr:hypothetical protein [Halobacteriovorax sp. JY17]PIK16605.1 MAG: hypothetical protein CES88_07635 [Halobacteriovorax sp. JY17]
MKTPHFLKSYTDRDEVNLKGKKMSVRERAFELEHLEKYHGDIEEVTKTIEDCPTCGKKLIITHWADCTTLVMEESAQCIECDYGSRKTLHSMN